MKNKTKSQRFVDALADSLIKLGAKEFNRIDSFKSFQINTIVGNLEINISTDSEHCYTMFSRFYNVEEAKLKFDCNPYSGKYNKHIGNTPDMTPEEAADICLNLIKATQPNNSLIHNIVSRKEGGIDCTEEESLELKNFIKSHIEFVEHFGEGNSSDETTALMKKIQNLFPFEIDEAVEETGL